MNACKVQIRISVITKKQQIQNVQYAPKQKIKQIARSLQTQTFYVRNLSDYTTDDDLYELLGLRSTKYLKQNCSMKMSTNSNAGKKKYFAYVTAPEHVTTELIKLMEYSLILNV